MNARALAALAAAAAFGVGTPAADATPPWTLIIHGDEVARFDVQRGAISIGNGPDVDIRIAGLGEKMAVLTYTPGDEDGPFTLVRLDEGREAITINDAPAARTVRLSAPDELRMGRYRLELMPHDDCLANAECAELTPSVLSVLDPPSYVLRLQAGLTEQVFFLSNGGFQLGSGRGMDVSFPALAAYHAWLDISPQGVQIGPGNGTVYVNGEPLEGPATVTVGDPILLGYVEMHIERPPGVDPATAATRAIEARNEEFEKTAYQFCHDPAFGQDDDIAARRLCALIDKDTASDVCPAALESCPWGTKERSGWLPRIPVPAGLLRAGFLMLLVGLVVWFVVSMLRSGWEEGFSPAENDVEEISLDVQRLPEARSQVLLRRATEAFATGDPRQAAVLAHLAVLRHLDDSGLARYHPSKTNGDYARAIRRHKPLQQLFRRLGRQTERIRFGDGQVDPDEVQAVLAEAPAQLSATATTGHLSPTGTATPSGGAVAGLLLISALGPLACNSVIDRPYYAHAPEGMAALASVLEAAGLEVEICRCRLNDLPENTGVVLLRSSARLSPAWPEDLKLDAVLSSIPIVLIDDAVMAHRAFSGLKRRPHPVEGQAKPMSVPRGHAPCVPKALANADLAPVTLTDDGAIEVLPRNRVVTASISEDPIDMIPLIGATETSSTGGAATMWAARRIGATSECFYVLNQRTLFTNASLTRPENAAFAAAFFSSIAGPRTTVAIVERLDAGMVTNSAGDGAGNAFVASNMLPFLLQTLATLLLVLVAVGDAFGPLHDTVTREHKEFVEHVEALGRHYARAGHRGLSHSAHSLARLVVSQNRERVRPGAGGWRGLVRDLAEKHDLPEEDVLAALRLGLDGTNELGAPSPSDPPPHSDRVLGTLNRLLSARDAHHRRAKKTPVYRRADRTETSDAT